MYTGIYAPVQLFSAPVPTGKPTVMSVPSPLCRTVDLQDGGRGRISGTVRVDSTPDYPVWRRVRLFNKRDGRLIREQWSDPVTGAYAFEHINHAIKYVVVAHDHTGAYNAEIRDAITPEPMP